MEVIRTLVVCWGVVFFAMPSSSHDLTRTWFLISGPEVLHAGTPTPLAVTIVAGFPGRVTAELARGNTIAAQTEYTEDFQGGLTRVLTLPPIRGSTTQNSLFSLTVRGYKGDSVIFTSTTNIPFSRRNVTTFIQTDRSRYQPGDSVRVRTVSVRLDNRPYTGGVEVSVQDPSGKVVFRRESTANLGFVFQEFTLSPTAPLGQWAITTTVNGVTDEKKITVENQERTHFEVLVKMPSRVLVGDDISGSVRALYSNGQPVLGKLVVSVTLAPPSHHMLTHNKEIYGSTQFFFSNDQLQALRMSSGISSDSRVRVAASVTSDSTGFKVNKAVEVHFMRNTYRLMFHNFPPSLKPSLQFYTTLRISRFDREPLSSQDRMHLAGVEVTQRNTTTDTKTTLTVPVPEDGDVHIKFKLQVHVEMLFIRAMFRSSVETLRVYNNYSSPDNSYIQISPINTLPAQIGVPLQIDVESTFKATVLHFVVSSRGQVLTAGTKNSSSFSLTPMLAWSPEACLTVYCILSNGEVASDTAHIPISQQNYVSLKWSRDEAQPGEKVTLSVKTREPMSQVGIVVMGSHDDVTAEDAQDVKVKQECNIRMLTNAQLNKKKHSDGLKDGFSKGDVLLEKSWSHWRDATESFLWFDTHVSDKTWTSGKITVPDGFTSLRAVALVMSANLGLGFTPVPQKLTLSKDFSLSLNVPSYLIRGEEIVLEVNIINHVEHFIEVIVLIAQGKAFEFVLGNRGDVSVVNAQKFTIGSHASATALFPIKPVALGEMEISVDAVSADSSESQVLRVLVKPEGVERSYSKTLFLELAPENHSNSRSISYSLPTDVVLGSQRFYVAVVGDILALSFRNLESLVQMPIGCGEQNMINFAPSIYVLQYLDKSTVDDEEIRIRALGYLREGYQRQLSYQRDDGSFSAFGASDISGSTWLTAFVLRCFLQAKPYMQVDQRALTRATTWLLKHQGPQGEFSEVGRLIHTEMQGGQDNGSVALTAYVLIALLEDETHAKMYPDNVSLAQKYLENKVSGGMVSNYSLCLMAYALALSNSPVAGTVLSELFKRADYTDGVMMWRSSVGMRSHDWQPSSAQIEMASYVLLALFRRARLVEGIATLKWLSKQRNHRGGYSTIQDTVVALQALSYYAAFSGANSIDLRLNISAPASSFESLLSINSTTYRTYQSQEIKADKHLHLDIFMEGRGFAIFQVNIFYNVESKALSQNLQHSDEEAFSLDINVNKEKDHNEMMVIICTRLKDNQGASRTGTVILDVGVLSGFRPSPETATTTDVIRKVELLPEKVVFYLESVTKSEVCVRVPIIRAYKVAHVQDAVVQAYDYHERKRKAERTYNSNLLHNMDSCVFCGGPNCDRCRPGLTITSASTHSGSSTPHTSSFMFLGITTFFFGIVDRFYGI